MDRDKDEVSLQLLDAVTVARPGQTGGLRLLQNLRLFIAITLIAFIVAFDPIRGYVYWATYFTEFGTQIGGTGGVGGLIGMRTCTTSFYCFWYDIPIVGLTWLATLLVLWWWGGWLLLSILSFYPNHSDVAASSSSSHDSEASIWGVAKPLFCMLRCRTRRWWTGHGSGRLTPRLWLIVSVIMSCFWLIAYIVYYFVLSDFYRSEAVLGISLSAACGLMLTMTVQSLLLGRFNIPFALLGLRPLGTIGWPYSLFLHKITGTLLIVSGLLHGGGELVYLTESSEFLASMHPDSTYDQGDPVFVNGTIALAILAAITIGLVAYRPLASATWKSATTILLIVSGSLLVLLAIIAALQHPDILSTQAGVFLAGLTVIALMCAVLHSYAAKLVDVWLIMHQVLGIVFMLASAIHFLPLIFYLLPGLAFWCADVACWWALRRWSRQHMTCRASVVRSTRSKKPAVGTILFLRSDEPVFGATQTISLRSSSSSVQSHTFSIVPSSACEACVFVDNVGDWSNGMLALVQAESQAASAGHASDSESEVAVDLTALEVLGPYTSYSEQEISQIVSSWSSAVIVTANSGLAGVIGFLDAIQALDIVADKQFKLKMHVFLSDPAYLICLTNSRVAKRWRSDWSLTVHLPPGDESCIDELALTRRLKESLGSTSQCSRPSQATLTDEQRSRRLFQPLAPLAALLAAVVMFLIVWSWRARCCASFRTAAPPQCSECGLSCTPETCSVLFNAIALIASLLASFAAAFAVMQSHSPWTVTRILSPAQRESFWQDPQLEPVEIAILSTGERANSVLHRILVSRDISPSDRTGVVVCGPGRMSHEIEATVRQHPQTEFVSLAFNL